MKSGLSASACFDLSSSLSRSMSSLNDTAKSSSSLADNVQTVFSDDLVMDLGFFTTVVTTLISSSPQREKSHLVFRGVLVGENSTFCFSFTVFESFGMQYVQPGLDFEFEGDLEFGFLFYITRNGLLSYCF